MGMKVTDEIKKKVVALSENGKKLSQREIGEKVGIAHSTVGRILAEERVHRRMCGEAVNEITVNGVVYIPKAESEAKVNAMAVDTDGLRYCIIRTYSAGVHAGYVKERNGKEVTLINARRIWRWAGAFTLSELAKTGAKKPDECKFSVTIPEIILTEAIEIIPCTETARENIQGVKNYDYER